MPLTRREQITASIFGGMIGLAVAGYPFIYAPMKANHNQCGKVTLCDPETENPEYWRRAMCTQPKYKHLRVCKPEPSHD